MSLGIQEAKLAHTARQRTHSSANLGSDSPRAQIHPNPQQRRTAMNLPPLRPTYKQAHAACSRIGTSQTPSSAGRHVTTTSLAPLRRHLAAGATAVQLCAACRAARRCGRSVAQQPQSVLLRQLQWRLQRQGRALCGQEVQEAAGLLGGQWSREGRGGMGRWWWWCAGGRGCCPAPVAEQPKGPAEMGATANSMHATHPMHKAAQPLSFCPPSSPQTGGKGPA